jgi:long-chain acyl-CoA synthetase
MALDVELYRRTIYVPTTHRSHTPRQISVIDIHPEDATRTLLFVHGYGGSAMQWLYQLRFFGQSMHVIAPDLRGHGLSDDPHGLPYTMNGLVDDLDVLLDALHIQGPIYVISHSFGGAVATEYSLRHPDRVLGLVLIGVPTNFIIHSNLQILMNVPDPIFSRAAKIYGVALYAPQRTLKGMLNSILAKWTADGRVQKLTMPTLVVLGHRDKVFKRQDYEDMIRLIPGTQQVVIPVSAHLVQLERPDAVNRAITRFIQKKQQPSVEIENVGAGARSQGERSREGGEGELASALAARMARNLQHTAYHIEKPWLQSYDNDVPEQLPLPKQLLQDLLNNAARDFPDRPAIIFFGEKISYRELDLLSNRFAHALRKLGLQPADRVAIVLPNVPQCVIAFYGTLKAGGIVVLSSPLSTEEEIHYQLEHSGAQILLTLESYRPVAERVSANTNIKHIIYTDVREYLPIRQRVLLASLIEGLGPHPPLSANNTSVRTEDGTGVIHHAPTVGTGLTPTLKVHSFQQLLRSQATTPMDSSTASKDLALIQYTSGTTDIPKGVMLSHGNLLINIAQNRHWMPDARHGHETILGILPLSHSYGITSCMNMAIAIAASLVLLPTPRTDQILAAIKQHRPTIFPGIPAFYLAIANYPNVRRFHVSAIRICVSGSAPLPVEVQEAFEKLTRGRLVEGYGLTEASPVTHSNPLKGERRVGSIGIPMPGTSARIVDIETGEPLPPGEVGELLIRGPQVMQGYWRMPEETAQTLRDGWLHTGDLALMDEDGFFTIVDRKKDLIMSGPYNVYPRDVEEVLYEHPKVLEAVVISAPPNHPHPDPHTVTPSPNVIQVSRSPERSEGAAKDLPASIPTQDNVSPASPFIKAVVVLKRGEQATADELLAYARERLDSYKVPRQIEFRTELPKNIVGKVLRRLLIEA